MWSPAWDHGTEKRALGTNEGNLTKGWALVNNNVSILVH